MKWQKGTGKEKGKGKRKGKKRNESNNWKEKEKKRKRTHGFQFSFGSRVEQEAGKKGEKKKGVKWKGNKMVALCNFFSKSKKKKTIKSNQILKISFFQWLNQFQWWIIRGKERKGRGRGREFKVKVCSQFFLVFSFYFLLFSFSPFLLFSFFLFSMWQNHAESAEEEDFKEDLEMQFGFGISFSKDWFIAFHSGRIPPAIEHGSRVSWNISFLFLFSFSLWQFERNHPLLEEFDLVMIAVGIMVRHLSFPFPFPFPFPFSFPFLFLFLHGWLNSIFSSSFSFLQTWKERVSLLQDVTLNH